MHTEDLGQCYANRVAAPRAREALWLKGIILFLHKVEVRRRTAGSSSTGRMDMKVSSLDQRKDEWRRAESKTRRDPRFKQQ